MKPTEAELQRLVPRVTEFEVCLLERNDINYRTYAIRVSKRKDELWAVVNNGYCLGTDGEWVPETGGLDKVHYWFPLGEAVSRAIDAAPHVNINGFTARQALAKYKARHALG